MKKKLLSLFAAAFMLLGVQNASASVKLTALSGNNWNSGNEGPKALLDEQTNSKWGTWDGKSGDPVYIIMKSSAAIAPKSYELITANDTYNDTGRSWSQWKIYGGNFASDAEATLDATGWVMIDSKENQSLDKGSAATNDKPQAPYAVNKKDISETIANGTYYTYFKIVVEANEGGFANKYCQMDGFRFTNVKFAPQDVTFTCTAGKNYQASNGEGIDKMFDLDCNTKYCNNAGSDCYALVTASEPVYVWGYDLTTANDNNGGRKVTKWSLYGTNDETVAKDPNADGWVTLSNMEKNSWIEGKNWYTQRFFCNKGAAGTAYKYFKVTLDDGGFIQLSEFRFCYDTHRAVAYNWVSGPSDAAKNAFDGKPNPKWEGGNGDFVGKSFTIETADGESYAVKKYHFTTNDDGSWKDRAPKSWIIEGSNDNSSWTRIAEVNDYYAIHNANFTTYEFTPSNTTGAFRYVKLTINLMKGTGWSQIGDFQVLAVSDVSDKDYYTNMVNNATSFDRGSLSESDPWYVEYKALCGDADAVLATAISSGKYDPVVTIVEKLNYYVSLLTELKGGANYVAFDGSATWGDGHWKQLFDGKDGREGREGTKWGAHFASNDAKQYVIFRVKEAFKPFFYKLVTGGDTYAYRGRNWKTWNVYGANFATLADATYDPSKWTKLDARENITEEYLPFENNYPASFNFNQYPDGLPESYLYYMVEVIDSYTRSQGTQMNEMALCTQAEFDATRDPLVAEFDDFDTTRPIEADQADNLALFNEKFAALKTTADAVELTKLYNQCVALRAELEASMAYMDLLNNAELVGGVYQLGTPEALNYFSVYVNRGNPSLKAVLVADIDMTEKAYTPIGTDANKFVGSFDGQGHSVTLDINKPEEMYQGLFGHADGGASFSNLIIKGTVIGSGCTAALVGEVRGSGTINISRVGCEATVTSESDHIGAFVGNDWGYSVQLVIENSYNTGNITGANPTCVIGGAIKDESTFTNVYNIGTITMTNGGTDKFSQYNYGSCVNCYTTEAGNEAGLTTEISAEMITSGELCAKLGDVFHQVMGTGRPVFDATLPNVYEIAVSEAGYATFVPQKNIDAIPVGVEAFAAQVGVHGPGYVYLAPVAQIPADNAVIIKAAAGSYYCNSTDEARSLVNSNSEEVDNNLTFSQTEIDANGSQYILAKPEGGEVGFYQADSGKIAARKGYFTSTIGVKAFFFAGDDATGIETLSNSPVKGENIYNLAGQRISKMQKGVNVVNGKKIIY